MANSKVTFTQSAYPAGHANMDAAQNVYGVLTIAAGDYPANGLPVTFTGAGLLFQNIGTASNPFEGRFVSLASGYFLFWDNVHLTVRIFDVSTSTGLLTEVSTTTPSAVVADNAIQAVFTFYRD